MSDEEQKHLMQSYYDLQEKYYKLKNQVQQKENIIKEAKEYNAKNIKSYNLNKILRGEIK